MFLFAIRTLLRSARQIFILHFLQLTVEKTNITHRMNYLRLEGVESRTILLKKTIIHVSFVILRFGKIKIREDSIVCHLYSSEDLYIKQAPLQLFLCKVLEICLYSPFSHNSISMLLQPNF